MWIIELAQQLGSLPQAIVYLIALIYIYVDNRKERQAQQAKYELLLERYHVALAANTTTIVDLAEALTEKKSE
jgi:hypothetical protein